MTTRLKPINTRYTLFLIAAVFGFAIMFFTAVPIVLKNLNWFLVIWLTGLILIFIMFLNIFFGRELVIVTDAYFQVTKGPFGIGITRKFNREHIKSVKLAQQYYTETEKRGAHLMGISNWRIRIDLGNKTINLCQYLTKDIGNDLIETMKKLKYATQQ